MTMTRAQLMALASEVADAPSSTSAWSTAQVRTWLGVVHWQEWGSLLDRAPQLKQQTSSVTQDSTGKFLKTALNTGSGDTVQNWFRIQSIYDPNAAGNGLVPAYYTQSTYRLYPTPQPVTTFPFVWYEFGDYIQMQPPTAGGTLTVVSSWRPCRADLLSSDSANVDFPDGYEAVLAFETAAVMLMRAGRETGAAVDLKTQASEIRQAMLKNVARIGRLGPQVMAADEPGDWGSV